MAPAELEGKLMDHEAVNDVAVIGVEDREQHTEVGFFFLPDSHFQSSFSKPLV